MNFSGVKRISLEQGKKILQICTSADISDTEKISQCIKIYSGVGDSELSQANGSHLRAVYLQILRLILPENILPINCRYINTTNKLYELDLDAVIGESPDTEDSLPDNIETVLAGYCVRFRYQGHGFNWEEVADRERAAKDLLSANWRDIISCYLYLKERDKMTA